MAGGVDWETLLATLSIHASSPVGTVVEPVQPGQTCLSLAERQERLHSQSCLYCGKSDHFIASCPMRPKDLAWQ